MADQFSLPAAHRPRRRGEGDGGHRDHRLAAADRGDRRAAARADDGRRADRRAARPHPHQQAHAARRAARPVRHQARPGSRSWASARRRSTATTPNDLCGCRKSRRRGPPRSPASPPAMASLRGLPAGVLRGASGPLWRPRPLRPTCPPRPGTWLSALLAVLMGVAAGYNPKYAIAGAFGLAFVAVVLVDVTFGLCAFTFLSFLELLLVTRGQVVQLPEGGRLPADGLVAGPHLDPQGQERELRRGAPAVHVHPGAVPDLGAVELVLGGDRRGGRSTPRRATSRT